MSVSDISVCVVHHTINLPDLVRVAVLLDVGLVELVVVELVEFLSVAVALVEFVGLVGLLTVVVALVEFSVVGLVVQYKMVKPYRKFHSIKALEQKSDLVTLTFGPSLYYI